ncbi:MAG TPA: DNA mismatch repair protein MutS [Candidatus Angelobacter sp.]|jgi:DNA mismatch repair protein MutS|nr:DNA mismatch repair protein MutS [Candidatus Angelobacter sp.]
MTEPSTPLMRQYAAIKKQHPNALLFFRLGDFYELFFEDAVVAARELQITLTSRNKEKDHAIPMCGVPYHAAENYLSKLLRKGFKVAICEQMEVPSAATKLVRREVTRVLTPGTAIDSSVGSEENNFLAALARASGAVGLAALDLSTGEFRATEFRGPDAERRIVEELQQLRPREVLYPSGLPLFDQPPMTGAETPDERTDQGAATQTKQANTGASLQQGGGVMRFTETPLEDWVFSPDYAVPLLENKLGVLSLEGFGLQGRPAAATAAGAILHYVRSTQRGTMEHVDRIGFYDRQEYLVLDAVTVRNLELVEPLFANTSSEVTLFRALDATLTPMGKRLLRSWMLRPSIEKKEINRRLDAVEAGVKEFVAREELRRALEGVLDIERLLSRVTLETANPRDVLALCASLNRIPRIKVALARLNAARHTELNGLLDDMADLRDRIEKTMVAEPPLTLADGGVIQPDVDKELDELRNLSRNSKQYIAQIEERERKRTGINSLKVKFNSVFGYYIEISKSNLHHAPPDYERKQTLVNAERYTTPELKEYETKVLDAQEKIVEIERRLFTELRTAIAAEARRIRQTSLALAEVDVLASFAFIAQNRGYCRPQFSAKPTATSVEKAPVESDELEIIAGRHPVLEQLELTGSNDRFVPNDLYLNASSHSILLITGPNMGGKSTYLRQTALTVLMAQMGGFVPARSARLPIIDRIFTRIGASDNLARGRSTFMVEMTETAAILNTATPRSLILLDEIGRGTSTYDGLAIAWAVVEYIHSTSRAKTLFATHYHELTELERLSGVKNFHVSVKENAGGIVFLRKVEPGAADRSYGIEVGKLAGLPPEVVVRAREVLHEHESAEQQTTAHLSPGAREPEAQMQLTMFTPLSQKIVDRLKEADLNNLTPMEAMNLLWELKSQL